MKQIKCPKNDRLRQVNVAPPMNQVDFRSEKFQLRARAANQSSLLETYPDAPNYGMRIVISAGKFAVVVNVSGNPIGP